MSFVSSFQFPLRIRLLTLPLLKKHSVLRQKLRQLPALMHRNQNVTAANKLPREVKLRDRRPVRILLDALPQLVVLEDVEGGELGRVNALHSEDLDRGAREAALGCLGRALHEENHGGRGDGFVDGLAGLVGEEAGEEGAVAGG